MNSGQQRLKFPSSNMVSTTNTSNNLQQFAAYPNSNFSQSNRISCPIKLRSKGKFDSKLKVSAPKFRSGEASKNMFIK